jgi:hypothetical protein
MKHENQEDLITLNIKSLNPPDFRTFRGNGLHYLIPILIPLFLTADMLQCST